MEGSRRLLSCLLTGVCLCAQQPDAPVYRTQTPIVILPTSVYDKKGQLISVGKEVHHQYLLSLTPDSDAKPTYHSLTVSIKDQPRATIHTRAGYWSVQ